MAYYILFAEPYRQTLVDTDAKLGFLLAKVTDSTASLSWTLPYHAWKYSEFVFGYIPRYPSVLRVCIIMINCYKDEDVLL